MTRTVLISGGGIAGTALAAWLHRYGFAPTVVERHAARRDGGYKVDVRGAALTVIDRMGLLPAVRAVSTDIRSGTIVTAAGRRLASMSGDTFGGRVHQDAELHRGDLLRILAGAAPVEYLFDDSIDDLVEHEGGVNVTFQSGLRRDFDLVVGADGLHSRVRTLAFGDGGVSDLGYFVSIFSVPNRTGLDREEVTYVAPGRTALVYSTARDAGAKAMFLFAREPGQSVPADRAGQQALLKTAYREQGWEVPRLLEDMADAPDFYLDSLSQVHLPGWSRGRVVLLGDAAYCASPASGQGTSLALVGAHVLAGELAGQLAGELAGELAGKVALAGAEGDHAAAFAAYEAQLRPFVARNQKLGPANIKRMVLATKGQLRVSLAFLALLNRMPGKEWLMAKAIEPIHRAATAITLRRY